MNKEQSKTKAFNELMEPWINFLPYGVQKYKGLIVIDIQLKHMDAKVNLRFIQDPKTLKYNLKSNLEPNPKAMMLLTSLIKQLTEIKELSNKILNILNEEI